MRRLVFYAVAGWLLLLGGRAFAYPQFQFSSGTTRCSQCHYSPAGGGLITSWGRDEAGDTISRGGDGGFAHGAWTPPQWVALGADVRLAALYNNSGGPEAPERAAFPMQADLYARFAITDQWSVYLEGGARGDTRPPDSAGYFDTFESAEHYLMWKQGGTGYYARAGRFFAPMGLRFVEHIFFVQRYTGQNLYDQPYTVSGGRIEEDWELHVSAFAPPPSGFPNAFQPVETHESGGAAYYERRFNAMAALGVQARGGVNSEYSQYTGGLVGKLWLEKPRILFLGEGDLMRKSVSAGGAETQAVTYLGATFFPTRGWMAGVSHEYYQEDLSVKGTARNAFDFEVNFFPWAHFELLAFARYQFTGTGAATDPAASLFMFQFHYYL